MKIAQITHESFKTLYNFVLIFEHNALIRNNF